MNSQTDHRPKDDHLSASSSSSWSSSSSSLRSTTFNRTEQQKWSSTANAKSSVAAAEYLRAGGLLDENWRRRHHHVLRKLQHLAPTLRSLDRRHSAEYMLQTVLLQLGDEQIDVRRMAEQLLMTLVDQHADDERRLEQLLDAIIGVGFTEWTAVDAAVCLNTMRVLPALLQRIRRRRSRNISPKVLGRLVESLAKRLLQVTQQKQALHALTRVRRVIGESLFDHFLETHYPRVKRDFDLLSDVYGDQENADDSDDDDDNNVDDDDDDDDDTVDEQHDRKKGRGTESQPGHEESEDVIAKVYDEYGNEIVRTPSRRVTFGGEVVKIRTPDSDATNGTNGATTRVPETAVESDVGQDSSERQTIQKVESRSDVAASPKSNRTSPLQNGQTPPKSSPAPPPNPSRIPLPVRPALHEPRWRKRVFRRPIFASNRLWSSSDDVHLNVDVDVNVLLENIGVDFDYALNEQDSSSSSEDYRRASSSFDQTDRKQYTKMARSCDERFKKEDWRTQNEDELDHVPTTKRDRTQLTIGSEPNLSNTNTESEDTLNTAPAPSKLPVSRLKSKSNGSSMRRQQNVTASLPSLRDVNTATKLRYSNSMERPHQQQIFGNSQKEFQKKNNGIHTLDRCEVENENIEKETKNEQQPSSTLENMIDLSNKNEWNKEMFIEQESSNFEGNGRSNVPTKVGLVKSNPITTDKKIHQSKLEQLPTDFHSESRKPGVRLKRSLTKEIQIPRGSYNKNVEDLGPFAYPKDALQKILLQISSNEWETTIQALQGLIRLSKHHSKLLYPCLHFYAIAVSKEIKNLRSQVARAACSCAENIFRHVKNIVDQNIEELSNSLFLRCTDTNKFLREDSNKALDAMVDNVKFSKSLSILTHKGANHVNGLVRASAARLLMRLLKLQGTNRILALPKEKRELIFSTVLKLFSDGNMETRSHAKSMILFLADNERLFNLFGESLPRSAIVPIDKFLMTAKIK